MNIYQSASTIEDNGDGTIIITGYYVQLAQISHPNTSTWGTEEAGRMWFCTTHNCIEYWNGTAVVSVP